MTDKEYKQIANTPLEIDLMGHKYQIILDKTNSENLGEDTRGKIYYDDCKIYLDKNLTDSLLSETLYHEIAHAITENTFFNNHLMEVLGDSVYEIFIDSLGRVIHDMVLRNNMPNLDKKLYYNKHKKES